MSSQYLTIASNHTYEQDIKKSRFICSLSRIKTEEGAKTFLATITAKYAKANHHCFAYLLGDHDEIQRESDNGEPSGTAGVPILQVLQRNQIHDTIAVVTRYFGGIKLGAGGLIRAYSGTTANAIQEVGRVERILQDTVVITVPYTVHDQLVYDLQQSHINIADQQYGVDVTLTVYLDHVQLKATIQDLTDRFHDQLNFVVKEPHFNEVPYAPTD